MSQCQSVCPVKGSYNAVNIKINNPQANLTKVHADEDNKDLNAVNLEINNPELQQIPIYSYPEYNEAVPADMAIAPAKAYNMPASQAAYKPLEGKSADRVEVPAPNLTSPEKEKLNMAFHGINFRADKPIVAAKADMKPAVDIEKTVGNLNSKDYDVQAAELGKIISAALNTKGDAIPYITPAIFSAMIEIAEKDNSALEGPSGEQIDIRKKIITNEILREKQLSEGKKPEEIKLPYEISGAELNKAMKLSTMELAERNKEYAILTLGALSKVYTDEFRKKTGNVVPLTDLPGASTIVETLKTSKNPSVKVAAIESLVYVNCPEYKKEISTVLEIVSKDKNPAVAKIAQEALNNI